MIRKTKNGIVFYEFEIFRAWRKVAAAAVFTRTLSAKNRSANKTIKLIMNARRPPFTFKKQLHSAKIHVIKENDKRTRDKAPNEAPNGRPDRAPKKEIFGDAVITNVSDTPLAIRIADCASIMLFDPKHRVIANIHAGWRGLAQRIIRTTLQEMKKRFGCNAKNILAAVSPIIGPCCYQFSSPEKELPAHMHQHILEENMVDLWVAVDTQLRECGIKKNHIENPRHCTACNPEEFISYRREGGNGRCMTSIMLK